MEGYINDQKIYNFILKIFNIGLEIFQILNNFLKNLIYKKSFLFTNISIKIILKVFFEIYTNIKFNKKKI